MRTHLTSIQLKALEDFEREMTEVVIPEIVRRQRENAKRVAQNEHRPL